MTGLPLLSALWLLPALGGIVLLAAESERWARRLALGFSGAVLALVLLLAWNFDPRLSELQFEERISWIPSLQVEYRLGVDGLSLVLVFLTAGLVLFALAASRGMRSRAPSYYALFLWMEAGLMGTFTAWNFIPWFLFWEITLIPAFLLVYHWGGARRQAAALQFFLYTFGGSLPLLLAFQAIYLATGSFDFERLAEWGSTGELVSALSSRLGWYSLSTPALASILLGAILLAFAVKVPLFPFHTWLPQTYAEAPAPVVMVLTGVLSKMGLYGVLRLAVPLFPELLRAWQPWLLALALATLLLSALAALAQQELRRALAYASVNHLGYCWLGIAAFLASGPAADRQIALGGVVLQMLNHGITAAVLFWFAGLLEQRQAAGHAWGGWRIHAPVLCAGMGLAVFSAVGLPGLNGFVSEFLIFRGTFAVAPWAAALALPGLFVTAWFMVRWLQAIFWGPSAPGAGPVPDLTWRERLVGTPALALMVAIGLFPSLWTRWFLPAVEEMARRSVP